MRTTRSSTPCTRSRRPRTRHTSWTSGSFFGGGVDFRVFKNLTVGVSATTRRPTPRTPPLPAPCRTRSSSTGRAPSPTTEGGLYRRENATHLSFGWIVPVGAKLDVLVSGGPSFFRLRAGRGQRRGRLSSAVATFTEVVVDPTVVTQKRSVDRLQRRGRRDLHLLAERLAFASVAVASSVTRPRRPTCDCWSATSTRPSAASSSASAAASASKR